MIDVPVEVKDALREGRLRKNYRVVVLNADGTEDFTIDNDTLVSESVSIDERMCSGDTIKFGLCEGSSLEFQYFNHENITDRQVQVFCDVEYGADEPYSIPMGFFTVKNCSRQASTGIIKVTAYNKLQSEYLDAKANDLIELVDTDTDNKDVVSVYAIQEQLLNDYQIKEADGTPTTIVPGQSNTLSFIDSGFTFKVNGSSTNYYPIIGWKERGITVPEGKKLKISALTKYITKLNSQLENLWQDIRDNCQNAETVISNLKSNTSFQVVCGIDVGFHAYSGSVPNPHYELRPLITEVASSTITAGRCLITNVYTLEELSAINNQLKVRGLIKDSMYFTNVHSVCFCYITQFGGSKSSTSFSDPIYVFDEQDVAFEDDDFVSAYYDISDSEKIQLNIRDIPDITLRELVAANYELNCQFGQLSRTTDLFSGVELNHSRLLPADSLYPDNALYPDGAQESAFRSQYSKLWADEGNIHKWRYLIITYKGLDGDGNETEYALQRTVNNDGTDNYNCSDNWLFRNLVWTAEQIGEYADAMVAKMQDITWFPFEMWCAGLPYLETGDEIEIPLGNQTYTSYILQRQLKGIQNLQDTYINGTLDIF